MYGMLLVCIITGFVFLKKLVAPFHKALPVFLLYTAVIQVISVEYSRHFHKSNHWIFNLFTPTEFIFYSLMLASFINSRNLKKIIYLLLAAYLAFAFYNILFLQRIVTFNTFSYIAGCFVVLCSCLFYFVHLASSENEHPLFRTPAFWITCGLLIMHTGDFLLFGMMDIITSYYPSFALTGFEIIKYIDTATYMLFTVSFLCNNIRNHSYS
jgi:hypothetical protein